MPALIAIEGISKGEVRTNIHLLIKRLAMHTHKIIL